MGVRIPAGGIRDFSNGNLWPSRHRSAAQTDFDVEGPLEIFPGEVSSISFVLAQRSTTQQRKHTQARLRSPLSFSVSSGQVKKKRPRCQMMLVERLHSSVGPSPSGHINRTRDYSRRQN